MKAIQRVLLAHSNYQQQGGEEQVFAAETRLLQNNHCSVFNYTVDNADLEKMHPLGMTMRTWWNHNSYRELRSFIRKARPQIAHFHNTFPLMSPSCYYAAKAEKIAVVQTLHNYRLLCPNAFLFRQGKICEKCVHKIVPWPAVAYSCYREDKMASAVVAMLLAGHRLLKTWSDMVDIYIVLTDFAKNKFIAGGLPAEKIVVKPNFIYPDPGPGETPGNFMLFVGRLSPEKGIDTLLRAWQWLPKIPLKIVGDGPMAEHVHSKISQLPRVEWLGYQPREKVLQLMKKAMALVFPSTWPEGLPMVIIEAYAVSLPVIAGNLGVMSSLIRNHQTGLLFTAGSAEHFATQIQWAVDHPQRLSQMGKLARAEFENKYTMKRNYHILMEIYQRLVRRSNI